MLQRLAFGFLVAMMLCSVIRADMVVADGDFSDGDWSADFVFSGVGSATTPARSSQNSANLPTSAGMIAGNPGVYRYFSQVHGGRQNGTMTIRGMDLYTAFEFDPSLGPLQALDISFDGLRVDNGDGLGSGGEPITFGAVVEQGDALFYTAGFVLTDFETWTRFEFNGLTESDFTFSGNQPGTPILDFSSAGDKISFGMYSFTSDNFLTGGRGGFDNFRVELNAVPEPSSLVLFGLGTLGLGMVSRRNRSATGSRSER